MKKNIQLPVHGGDLTWAKAHFPDAPAPWLDLSTGINPWPYPHHQTPEEAFTRLPDKGQEDQLRAALGHYLGAVPPRHIALTPGSEGLIRLLSRLRAPGQVEIVSPTYGGHAAAWGAAGHEVVEIAALEQASDRADVVVVVSPNNPDGRRADQAQLYGAAQKLQSRNGWLVLDQAFADLDPSALLPADMPPSVICLRSFGKFFGLPGLRLGFAIADAGLVRRIATGFGAWPVNGLALAVACEAYQNTDWITASRRNLAAAAMRLDSLLMSAGWPVSGGTSLFRLVAHPRVGDLFHHLATEGILTRIFTYDPQWLRIGLPGPEADWNRLSAALKTFTGNKAQ